MRKFFVLTSILLILLVALSLSSSSWKEPNDIPISTPTLSPIPTPSAQHDTDVSLLKLEVELLKKHNQQLLDTVYWSLGTVFTLALFVVGAGWYVNFRLYDKDKAEIKQSLESSLKERLNQDKEILQSFAIKSSEAFAAKISGQFDVLKQEIQRMKYEMLQEQAKSWRSRKVYANELTSYFEMLKIAKQFFSLGQAWLLSDALEGMQNALKSGAELNVELVREIMDVVSKLDNAYFIEVERIKDLLVASRNERD
jgi:hypothetical protein